MRFGGIRPPSLESIGCILAALGCLLAFLEVHTVRQGLHLMNDERIAFGAAAFRRDNVAVHETNLTLGARLRRPGFAEYHIEVPPAERSPAGSERLLLILTGDSPLFYARGGSIAIFAGRREIAHFVARGTAADGSGPFVTVGPVQQQVDLLPGEQPGFAFPITGDDCPNVCRVRISFKYARWLVSRVAITRTIAAANAANFGT